MKPGHTPIENLKRFGDSEVMCKGCGRWVDEDELLNEDELCEDCEYYEEEQDADELDSMLEAYEGDW